MVTQPRSGRTKDTRLDHSGQALLQTNRLHYGIKTLAVVYLKLLHRLGPCNPPRGLKEDHTLVKCRWTWRLQEIDTPVDVDYSALSIPGASYVKAFDDQFIKYFSGKEEDIIAPPPASGTHKTTSWTAKPAVMRKTTGSMRLTDIDTVRKPLGLPQKQCCPPRTGDNLSVRDVSERTRLLIRTREGGMDSKKCTTEQYESIQDAIKESSLQDYKDWVNNRVVEMETSDTRKVFAIVQPTASYPESLIAIVQQLSRKSKSPPQSITTNEYMGRFLSWQKKQQSSGQMQSP